MTASPPAHLGFDFHSHLLPGVDDGMESYADAKLAIQALENLGFTGAVITPHLYHGVFDNQAEGLRTAFDEFRASLKHDGVEFSLVLAGEYFADEAFLKLIERGDLLFIEVAGERWVLLEFPYLQESPLASSCLAALVSKGYRPVVAHVERYRFAAQSPEAWIEKFRRYDAVLQGDIGSLAGQHGRDVQRFADWLLNRSHIALWGTDIHRLKQIERYIMPGLARLGMEGRPEKGLNPVLNGMLS